MHVCFCWYLGCMRTCTRTHMDMLIVVLICFVLLLLSLLLSLLLAGYVCRCVLVLFVFLFVVLRLCSNRDGVLWTSTTRWLGGWCALAYGTRGMVMLCEPIVHVCQCVGYIYMCVWVQRLGKAIQSGWRPVDFA
eukprot:GHVS01087859.1.p1 GENE.GHVS01087859.1~~GHVS01087859.1.p1  ORF type:complete len:134 (+),score=16.50 GHVS01087859.1:114-515(+)